MLNLFEIPDFTDIMSRVCLSGLRQVDFPRPWDMTSAWFQRTTTNLRLTKSGCFDDSISMNQFKLRGKSMFKTLINAVIFSAFIFVSGATLAVAQSDDYNKAELFGGFLHRRVTERPTDPCCAGASDISSNGANISFVGYFNKSIGGKFDFAIDKKGGYYFTTYNGGIQFKSNSKSSVGRPFVHALFGWARVKGLGQTRNGLNLVVGGGLDIKASERISIRVIQADYNPIWFADEPTLQGKRNNTFRFATGIVFN